MQKQNKKFISYYIKAHGMHGMRYEVGWSDGVARNQPNVKMWVNPELNQTQCNCNLSMKQKVGVYFLEFAKNKLKTEPELKWL